jgi:hypothetical protein
MALKQDNLTAEPECPICHSRKVLGFKIFNAGKWWSQCVSGLDHGVCAWGDRMVEWPENPWFSEEGDCELLVDGQPQHVGVLRQEYRRE